MKSFDRAARIVALFAFLSAATALNSFGQTSWTDPLTTTPSFIQLEFGPYGTHLPGNGENYCFPTSVAMELYWMGANGFTQLAPSSYDPTSPPDRAQATNLIQVLSGLAGTDAVGGTDPDAMAEAVQVYFAAKGISTSQFAYTFSSTPTMAWFSQQIASNTVPDPTTITITSLGVYWYQASGTNPNLYIQAGGHALDLVASDTSADTITVFNPYPSSFVDGVPNIPSSNPQTVSVTNVPSDWLLQSGTTTMSGSGYQQVQSGTSLGDDSNKKAVLGIGQAWSVSTSALLSSSNYTLSTWQINSTQTINTNSGSLSVIAPLQGTGGIQKTGLGILVLANTDSLTGTNTLRGGTLQSTANAGTPFGTGSIVGENSSILSVSPDDSTPSHVSLSVVSGSASSLNLNNGGLILQLAKGANTSLTVTLGGNTDGTTPNINRSNAADLEIAPDAGLGALGNDIQLFVAGSGSNLPTVTNGMVSPYILGRNNDTAQSGAFLNYVSGTGFVVAETVQSGTTDINDASVNNTTIYEADTDVTVGISPVSVYALEVDNSNVGGSDSSQLNIGSQSSGDVAGLILNGGTISTSSVQFGGAQADIYTNSNGGFISSILNGTDGLTKFGPGALTLSANNSASLSGNVYINNGTLIAANSEGSATGSGNITIEHAAMLQINRGASVSGKITTRNSATLLLSGGMAEGDVNILGRSGVQPGAVLEGAGTIEGNAIVAGTIQAGPATGIINFTGSANLSGASFYWQVLSLVDNTTSGAGTGWNALDFSGAATLGTSNDAMTIYIDPSEIADEDPDTSDPFWSSTHVWSIFIIEPGSSWTGDANVGNSTFDDGSFGFTFYNASSGTDYGLLVYTPSPVPEPSVWALVSMAFVFSGVWRKKFRSRLVS